MNDSDKSRKPSAEGSQAHRDAAPIFPLSSTKGGEGRGEEAQGFPAQNPPPPPPPPPPPAGGGGGGGRGVPPRPPTPPPQGGGGGAGGRSHRVFRLKSPLPSPLPARAGRGRPGQCQDVPKSA